MKKVLVILMVLAIAMCSKVETAQALSLPDGTVTADRQDGGTSAENAWFGECVTTLTIDAVNIGEGECIKISGVITEISDPKSCYIEIGLIPMNRWEYWQTAYSGNWKSAVFNKGLHFVSWGFPGSALGASIQEGWDNWATTTYKEAGAYAWPLNRPTDNNPWEVSIVMYPDGSGGGEAYLWVDMGRIYGEEPFLYGDQDGNDNDYSTCYLIAQIWSYVPDAQFSFRDVQASVQTME